MYAHGDMKNKLTSKESKLLNSIAKGMDEPGCGALHELTNHETALVTKSDAAVLGSLIKKGLATSDECIANFNDIYHWVEITNKGLNIANLTQEV